MIVYLHGFRSSPHSSKARQLAATMQARGRAAEFYCPQLPASPAAAIAEVERCIAGIQPASLAVIGSSLGGFYATWLAEKTGCRAVVLNPAVHPYRDLGNFVGISTAYHSEAPFEFTQAHLEELTHFEIARITQPKRYLLIVAKGDELLDWREMTSHYLNANQVVLEGGDHGLSDFDAYLDQVIDFCGKGATP
ncbi:MAG: hypothetical protein K0S28_492 [Paucimonas sp.]|jgi:predicted esterase YcpF (UPF0227 family)|nr:hypothetical protein [Paucimonas sp.]